MARLRFGFRTLDFCLAEHPQNVHEQGQEVKVSLLSGDGEVDFVFMSICVNPLFLTRTLSIR